jgi:hypothetical protein
MIDALTRAHDQGVIHTHLQDYHALVVQVLQRDFTFPPAVLRRGAPCSRWEFNPLLSESSRSREDKCEAGHRGKARVKGTEEAK